MAENKTKGTQNSVANYLAYIRDGARRRDCEALAKLMAKATRQAPKMWVSSIVGFGSYHYKYESGREGDSCVVGFSSRSTDISVYGLTACPGLDELLSKLGKYKLGKGCMYIRKLSDIEPKVLAGLIAGSVAERKRQHGQGMAGT